MVKLEKNVQDNLNDLHDNHKMMISMKSASDKSKAVADDVERLSDAINFETLHINKVRLFFVENGNFRVLNRTFFGHFSSKSDIFSAFFIENDYKCAPLLFESDRKNYFLVFLGTFLGFFLSKMIINASI